MEGEEDLSREGEETPEGEAGGVLSRDWSSFARRVGVEPGVSPLEELGVVGELGGGLAREARQS